MSQKVNLRLVVVTFIRIMVGLLFIISGLIKANDPTGFAYKLDEYFEVFHTPFLIPYTVYIAMFICIFEIFLGVCLLVGSFLRSTLILLFAMMVFFTFLTWYSAYYNVVTDCGCFGDALKLTPMQSFTKDVVLVVLIIILMVNQRFLRPIFRRPLRHGIVYVSLAASILFTLYCYIFLPVKDFLPYAEGKDIVEQMKIPEGSPKDSFAITLVYEKDGKDYEFEMNKLPADLETYKWKETKTVQVSKAPLAPIHDFVIYSQDGAEVTDKFLEQKGYRMMIVQYDLEKSNVSSQKDVNKLVNDLVSKGKVKIWGFTSSSNALVDLYTQAHDVPYKLFRADGTMLKTMIRSNPGLILLKDTKVIKKWPGTAVPSVDKVHSLLKAEE